MPVLQPNTTHDGLWECDTCCEDYNAKTDQPWETIDGGDLVCTTCIRQQFERALELDYNWPARWGGDELLISDFESTFSPELVSQVKDKAAEMAAIDKEALLEAVKDLTRGKDYQICPGCKQIINLGSGCNHMTCHFCHTNFCFLCGEEVEEPEHSDHWAISRNLCPRYGPTGSEMFDRPRNTPMTNEQRAELLAIMLESNAQLDQEAAEEAEGRPFIQRFGAFYADSWAWTLAMQSLRDDGIGQDHLLAVLEQDEEDEDGEEDARPLWVNFEALLRQYHPEHVVPEQEWAALFQAGMPRITSLFENGPPAENSIHGRGIPTLHRGMLAEPVVAVFNMMSSAHRLEAFMWMYNATRDWETLVDEDIAQRSVVFDMGPGGDDLMRERVAEMMYFVRRAHDWQNFTFRPMQNAGLLVTLGRPVQVLDADGFLFLPGEAYRRRLMLSQIWGCVVQLDRSIRADPTNAVWSDLYRDASAAWEDDNQDNHFDNDYGEYDLFDGTNSMFNGDAQGFANNRARWQRFADLHIESWTWNVAIQNLQDDATRIQQVRLALGQGEPNARPLWDDFEALFRTYRPEHLVPEQDWEALFQAGMPEIRALFDNGPEDPHPGNPYYNPATGGVLHRGLLIQPVAAVFNMVDRSQRIAAFRWMCNTTRDWETLSIPQRSAVFDMGPGGDDLMRLRIVETLRQFRLDGNFEHFTFSQMAHAGLLVTAGPPLGSVEAQDGSVFVPGEAYWRRVLLLEFWGRLVHLDEEIVRDPGNIVWRDLTQEAADAWLEQRPDGVLGAELDF